MPAWHCWHLSILAWRPDYVSIRIDLQCGIVTLGVFAAGAGEVFLRRGTKAVFQPKEGDMQQTKNLRILTVMLTTTIGLAGCAEMTPSQRGTATGAGIGAGIGAILGATSGDGSGRRVAGGAAIGGAIGAIAGNIWSNRMEEQKRQMEQATQGTGVAVTQTADNRLKLEIPSDISFDLNRADIKPDFRPILDRFATGLVNHQVTRVTIVGHTDNTGSDAINDPLSVNRAARTRDYLATRGVASGRIVIDGRGSHEPLVNNSNEANRARNRRVEIFVAEQQATAQAPAQAPAPASVPSGSGAGFQRF
jgi:outer membrane protein OmpA-like peptidoglycan-associated protein